MLRLNPYAIKQLGDEENTRPNGSGGTAHSAPGEFAGAAYSVMIVERTLEARRFARFRMLVHRQGGARLPLREAGHLTLLLVLVEHLDRDASYWVGARVDGLGLTGRAADRSLDFLHRFLDAGISTCNASWRDMTMLTLTRWRAPPHLCICWNIRSGEEHGFRTYESWLAEQRARKG